MSDKGLEPSLIDSIGRPVAEVSVDLAEIGLDALLNEGVLRDVPVLSAIMGLWRTGAQVRDLLLAKKLARFLRALETVPKDAVSQFRESMAADSSRRQRVAEHLLTLLERLDDVEKSDLLARAFAAYLEGRVTYDDFRQVAFGIDRCFMADLMQIRYLGSHLPAAVGARLASAGLMQLAFRTKPDRRTRGSPYAPTSVGRLMADHVIERPSRPPGHDR